MIRKYGRIILFDGLLSFVVILTTTSRGSIIPFVALIGVYFYEKFKDEIIKKRGIVIMSSMTLLITGVIAVNIIKSNEDVLELIYTLDLSKEDNALSQRSVLTFYALNEFYNHPLVGVGLGALTGTGHKTFALGDGLVTDAITDAYLFSLLAEMGILGFISFLFSFYRITRPIKDAYSLCLFLCLLIQLTGTDLPNMYMFYFVMMLLLQHPNIAFCNK